MCVNVTLLLVFPFNSFSQERTPAPIYKDGDFWVFRVTQSDRISTDSRRLEGDYQISYAAEGLNFFYLTGTEKTEIDRGTDILKRMVGIDVKNTRYQYLQFPLFVGQKWKREYNVAGTGDRGQYALTQITAEHRLVGIDQFIIAAGTFRAVRINSTVVFQSGNIDEVYFYSPQTKSIVKYNYHNYVGRGSGRGKTDIELIKFGTAP